METNLSRMVKMHLAGDGTGVARLAHKLERYDLQIVATAATMAIAALLDSGKVTHADLDEAAVAWARKRAPVHRQLHERAHFDGDDPR